MEQLFNFESIDELILSFLSGTIAPEEKQYLKVWLSENNSNKEYFREIYLLWKAGSISDSNSNNKKIIDSLQKVHYKIFKTENDTPIQIDSTRNLILSKFKLAAIIVIMLGLGGVLGTFLLKNETKDDLFTLNEIRVPLGSKSLIVLPDKTEVWLNAGSTLSYSKSYGDKLREVNLEGEGYFKVAKMPEKPFIVHTKRANIKALGTEFNVKAYPEENTIETILVKGSVVVNKIMNSEKNQNSKNIVLKPGEKVVIFKDNTNSEIARKDSLVADNNSDKKASKYLTLANEMKPEITNTEVETSWKDPSWVIQGEGLKDLLVKIGRRYNVTIDLKDKELEMYKFSAIIENETLEQVFDVMSLTIPFSYNIEKGYVAISLNKKLENKYKKAYY